MTKPLVVVIFDHDKEKAGYNYHCDEHGNGPETFQLRGHASTAKDNHEQEHSMTWTPEYSKWRHGGWYVHNVRYPNGAIGCVSRNYADRKWRIVCDDREDAFERYTYPSRDAAARAEREIAQAYTEWSKS